MARIVIENHRVILTPGGIPEIELIVGRTLVGRCRFFEPDLAPVERAVRDPQTGFVELNYDTGDYDRVLGLLSGRQRPVAVGEELRLEG